MEDLFIVWKRVFGNLKYLSLLFLTAVLFYTLNVLVPNYKTIIGFSGNKLSLFFALFFGFYKTVTKSSFVTLVIISAMLGVLVSLLIFKVGNGVKNRKRGAGFLGGVGIALGVIAPGCAACGIGLLSVIGVGTAFLTFLPFNGLELSFLAIGLLGFSIWKVTKDLTMCKVCQIDLSELKGGKKNGRRTEK